MFGFSGVKAVATRLTSGSQHRTKLHHSLATAYYCGSSSSSTVPHIHQQKSQQASTWTTSTTTARRYKSALPEPDYYYADTNDHVPQHINGNSTSYYPPPPYYLNGQSSRKRKMAKKQLELQYINNNYTQQQQQQQPEYSPQIIGSLNDILNARVYDVAKETALQEAKNLSAHLQNNVLLKREDTQDVFSFKIRGAYNKMAHLSPEQLQQGVVCCSAGNHAQGVALSAQRLGCRAVIVMPESTPSIKVNAVRVHGGPTVDVRLFGNNYDEAAAEAKRLQTEESMTMIHPFDDPHVIAGQGTIGMEILKERVSQPLDAIFVCCGGGGMLAGIATYVKQVRPSVKVIGVEAEDAAGMTASLQAGRVVTLPTVGPFADGAAVKTVGQETFRICQELVDDMITVNTDEICRAIKMSYNDARVVLEPAGALGVAGLEKYVREQGVTGQTLAAITSGANMDFDKLGFISSRCKD